MRLHTSNPALRRALVLKRLTPKQHRQEIERLRKTHGHSIRFVVSREDETCAPYAFGLTADPTYRCIAGVCDVFAGKQFMRWVESRLSEIDTARPNCLVSYYNEGAWTHIGVVTPSHLNRVTSKWGTYPRYEHEVAEVSEEYGDDVKFFERPSPEQALALFVEFAHECGITDQDIAAARAQWRDPRP